MTTEIDVTPYLETKLAAMRAHATQISVNGQFFALSNNVGQLALGHEYFTLLAGPLGKMAGPQGREDDLFAALAQSRAVLNRQPTKPRPREGP